MMKTTHNRLAGRGAFGFGAPITTTLVLLAALTARADTPYTGTGWVSQVLAPGIICPTPSGILFRAGVPTMRVECTDARLTGKRTVYTDGYFQPDGSAVLYGAAYFEVGTWAGTNFTPSGGLWEVTWRGVMQTNYAMQLSLAGYGSGGTIDGLRMEETLTRGPASDPNDPAVPIFLAGTIKPVPVSTTLFSDDFSTGLQGWTLFPHCGVVNLYGTNQQLHTRADWTGCAPDVSQNTFFALAPSGTWTPADGQTVECQVDLAAISQNATNVAFPWLGTGSAFYYFCKSPKAVFMGKDVQGNGITAFWLDNTVQLPGTNAVLCLALTRNKTNLIITTRVLDKNNQNAVLFERGFVDTPGVDASLTTAQFIALTGITTWTLAPDSGPPILGGTQRGVAVFQFTDGHQPPVDAIFDNFSLRLHDVPPLSIARAVRLSWPALAGVNYTLQGAPTVQGPWLPVPDWTTPNMNQVTVPASDLMQFFRAVQAP